MSCDRPDLPTMHTLQPASSQLDPSLLQAYRETEYRVLGSGNFILRVGEPSAALLAAHERHKAECSAFLTACNPFSQALGAAANATRQLELARELAARSLSFLPGCGAHPSGDWPAEESFLVFGLALEAAKALGARLGQNAFLWSGKDAVPNLVVLR